MAFLTYLAAHWILASGVTLAVAGLGIAAYVFKNLKFAVAAIALAVAGFMYQGAVTHGIELQLQKDLAAKVAIYEGRLKTLGTIEELNTKRALEDAVKIEELEKLANETPANSRTCLDIDGARRLRSIQ